MIKLVGSSPISSDEAIRNAVAKAGKTIDNMRWFQVVETRGHIHQGAVAHFQVTVEIGFAVAD
jgi:flavin-binding protein dodecin